MGQYCGISVARVKIIGIEIKDREMKKAVCTLQERRRHRSLKD
jgi:hypothetical protein